MIVSKFGLTAAGFRVENLPAGAYFWRVAALDAFGLPGERSKPWRFTVTIDTTPPFLKIDQPADESIVPQPLTKVEGKPERGAAISVNGQPADPKSDGRYWASMTLSEGDNSIEVTATAPAGNLTKLSRHVRYMPDR